MKERPILFSAPMIRAILGGTKTQTRRLVRTREPMSFLGGAGEEDDPAHWGYFFDGRDQHGYMVLARGLNERHDHGRISIPCPHGEVGDKLWVRETHAQFAVGNRTGTSPQCVAYRATCDDDGGFDYVNNSTEVMHLKVTKWTPAIYMPRWASRITLEITDLRVQRLQDISEMDIIDEGVDVPLAAKVTGTPWGDIPDLYTAWRLLWDHINGARRRREEVADENGSRGRTRTVVDTSARWEANPWIWAITFKQVEQRQ